MPITKREAKNVIRTLTQQPFDNQLKKGASLSVVADKIAPIIGASITYRELKKVPVLKDFMTWGEKFEGWWNRNTWGRVPVLKWVNALAGKVLNAIRGNTVDWEDWSDFVYSEWEKKNKSQEQQDEKEDVDVKVENNELKWYGSAKLPVNEDRPMGIPFNSDVFPAVNLGKVPRLLDMNVEFMDISKSPIFNNMVSNVYQAIRDGLRSNLNYSISELREYLFNSISLYLIGKQIERRLGFTKFVDTSMPEFRDVWIRDYDRHSSYGIIDTNINAQYDSQEADAFETTLNNYNLIIDLKGGLILPKYMKAWIDHYAGSVFTLDRHPNNAKYFKINFVSVPLLIKDGDKYVMNYVDSNLLKISDFYSMLYKFNLFSGVLRADLMRAQVKEFGLSTDSKDYLINHFSTAWFTPFNDYQPVIIRDQYIYQLIKNAYTGVGSRFNEASFSKLFEIRYDFDVAPNATNGDYLTTLLCSQNLVELLPSVDPALGECKLCKVINQVILAYGNSNSRISVPKHWVQSGIESDENEYTLIHFSAPIAFVATSTIQADTYTAHSTGTGVLEYPNSIPRPDEAISGAFTASFAIDNGSMFTTNLYGMTNTETEAYVFVPLFEQPVYNGDPTIKGLGVKCTKSSTVIEIIGAYSMDKSTYITNYGAVDRFARSDSTFSDFTSTGATLDIEGLEMLKAGWVFVGSGVQLSIIMYGRFTVSYSVSTSGFEWIYPVYGAQSITKETVTFETSITDNIGQVSGYHGYASWFVMAADIAIPIFATTKNTISNDGVVQAVYLDESLLKEDEIPAIVSVRSIPATAYNMLKAMLSFDGTVVTKDKNE